jgi:PPOX class probable F420-dependent enzyme
MAKANSGGTGVSALTATERSYLSGTNLVFLATLNPDGSPHVTPMWAEVEGDYILMNTMKGRGKERNIRRDPRVALSATSAEDPYEFVALRGEVVEISEDLGRKHIEKLSQKYLGKPYPWPDIDSRLIIKIRKTSN